MTITSRLASIHRHMTAFALPEPWSVTANGVLASDREHVMVQLSSGMLPHTAAALLTWADTLTAISTTVWRTPSGDSVHLDVCGRLADGTTVRVFDGVAHDPALFALAINERRSVALDCLRDWAMSTEVAA